MKYAFIKAHQTDHSVSLMCEVFELSTSAYYEWVKCPVSLHAPEDQRLAEKIKAVVGWAMAPHMKATLVNDALLMATFKRKPEAGLIVHSDRGSQYASRLYQKTLDQHQFISSMSRKGNRWDNAPAESFFHTLKTELCHHDNYLTREQAQQTIFEYIEVSRQ